MTLAITIALAALVAIVSRRPHGAGPAIGGAVAVAIAAAGGAVEPGDLERAFAAQWRPFLTLLGILVMTAAADQLGLLERVAAWIEPRTRGPVRHAFRVTYLIAAATASLLSNDAAILLLTPAILALLRTVYPRRHPNFTVPFAFAIFVAAGVAPLVISNPMNLVFVEHVGIGFNRYAAVMVPVALVGWAVSYALLAWYFRAPLADDAPALGAWPATTTPLGAPAIAVVLALAAALLAYPIAALVHAPLWPIAVAGGVACAIAALAGGVPAPRLAGGVPWSVFPFLLAVFVIALGLERAGAVAELRALYADDRAPLFVVGGVSSLGSALLNNHPMSVLNALALGRDQTLAFAALVGGNLGPRLLPMGSLAGLLWFDTLRRHGVTVRFTTFVAVGAIVTLPTLAVSLLALAALRAW